ncbi:Hypothetical protein CpMEX30_0737 [Corynebacterium pseudotuberculosis]|uniref:Uncharacterized protein n=2 Tax=Corynebacterium pseudotuberculosis TaxID=1719 RepID=A0A6D2LTP0_CORP2|nr:hypothetical protein [Corynebacterium pseudotuberculosis]AEX39169.1 Hypothetical protein Cp3995_0703 [Corynebacterium pseudotuberculosis 3/99-5]AFH51626.1 Hypothetical protein Cp267_0724 [Corynebacterium pseudotuberculosis 267]AFK16336.1 hypothetical protein CP258_03625 [Corynebacterium pseudotuberculosis 258]ARK36766.1 hypothetical protein CPI19_08040 [Corynebacterium pseudotuberculosis I19]ART29249.1 hypothetical protein CPCIP5297_03630 [Corynebacterium pseudotuberculosis CIP 52.97]QGW57
MARSWLRESWAPVFNDIYGNNALYKAKPLRVCVHVSQQLSVLAQPWQSAQALPKRGAGGAPHN